MWGFSEVGFAQTMLCGLLVLSGQTASAEGKLPGGPPLDAEAFDRLTLGKRMDTFDPRYIYGVEEFLPGHRSIWRDADGCTAATWQQVGDQICFTYESNPDQPACWVYNQHEGAIWGWFEGQPEGLSVRLVPSTSKMACDYLGV